MSSFWPFPPEYTPLPSDGLDSHSKLAFPFFIYLPLLLGVPPSVLHRAQHPPPPRRPKPSPSEVPLSVLWSRNRVNYYPRRHPCFWLLLTDNFLFQAFNGNSSEELPSSLLTPFPLPWSLFSLLDKEMRFSRVHMTCPPSNRTKSFFLIN